MQIVLPNRFEGLSRNSANLSAIIVPIENSLDVIDAAASEIRSSGSGLFLILRGKSGAGKTTFLRTVPLFRQSVLVETIQKSDDIVSCLRQLPCGSERLRIIMIEGREALGEAQDAELENAIHGINQFLRSDNGSSSLVVWPCNTDATQNRLELLVTQIGAESMAINGKHSHFFTGPDKSLYHTIVNATVASLNSGASLADFGITDDEVSSIVASSETVGEAISRVRNEANGKRSHLDGLLKTEKFRLWIAVIAGSEPLGEVSALTRSVNNYVDIDRLMTATDANIVKEIKKQPEKIGLIANSLDVRLFHIPVSAALSAIRSFASDQLIRRMDTHGLSTVKQPVDALERLRKTDLATAFSGNQQGRLQKGGKVGSNSLQAFERVAKIAENNDSLLNRALGTAICKAQFAETFEVECDLGTGLKRKTDIVLISKLGRIRLEMMWRKKTSRAEIANYVLTKVWNYGNAVGLI